MGNLEKNIPEQKIKNPDKEISKIGKTETVEYTSINIERTADICKEFGKIDEYKTGMCEVLNNNFIDGLDGKIDFSKLLNSKIA